MQEMTMEMLFSQGQIRLSELSVFNWGSFDGLHTARIDPDGTLITGDNGSGKSTFIDGLMALLQPAGKASFNVAAAQGDRSDRSLLSYMRGSYGSEHDGSSTRIKSKRDKAVTSAVRALYTADDGSHILLAGLFWIGQGSNSLSDVRRLYMVASKNIALQEILEQFSNTNVRQLKQKFNPKENSRIHYFDSDFADYQQIYSRSLFMDNPNAPALLSRALGLKKIDDLTKLIRELVLESSNLRESAQIAVNEFADLEVTYNHLIDSREQEQHLGRLPDLASQIEQLSRQLGQLKSEKQSLTAYFGELFTAIYQEQIAQLEIELQKLQQSIQQISAKIQDCEEKRERSYQEYINIGGNQIEILQKDLRLIFDKLHIAVNKASNYQDDMKQLGLPDALEQSVLEQNQKLAAEYLQNIGQVTQQLQDEFGRISGLFVQIQQKRQEIEQEIKEIHSRPDSNIHDMHLLRLKDELKEHLGFTEHELAFIGELIDVKEDEKPWQGAIERALGGLRTTLLVPSDRYSMVTQWVNARDNKTHVRLQIVNVKRAALAQFRENGFLKKLKWREHPYRDWLKQHLLRFDLQCVENTQSLNQMPFSMTQQGLIHLEQGRFEKKDQHRIDERKTWCLGFSNKSRLALLQGEADQLSQDMEQRDAELRRAREALNANTSKKQIWDRLEQYQWNALNISYWESKRDEIQEAIQRLQQADSDVEQARLRWEQIKQQLERTRAEKSGLDTQKGELAAHYKSVELQLIKAQQDAALDIDDGVRLLLSRRIPENAKIDSQLQMAIDADLFQNIDRCSRQMETANRTAIGIMSAFRGKDKWAHIPLQREWSNDLLALKDYVCYLEELQREGLPKLVKQFQQRLHKHTTQSLGVLQDKLERSREDIIERIERINGVLKRTEFRAGSYLRLGYKREKYPHVQHFEKLLKTVISLVNNDDYGQRYKSLAELMGILDKASSSAAAHNQESLRLLDPRYQMAFHAEEVEAETGVIRDVLESSSGKSGGEKESFAGIIVAASLAYVLTPDGYDHPIYSTVFLDEAFSNTAESVSRRVLSVFNALKIHVNLITPYKNLNLARESARSLLIAERDAELHESRLCEVTWQEIDEQMRLQAASLQQEAEQLGIQLNG